MTVNYKLIIKGMMTHFFPQKALQHQNRYPRQEFLCPKTPKFASSFPMSMISLNILNTDLSLEWTRYYLKMKLSIALNSPYYVSGKISYLYKVLTRLLRASTISLSSVSISIQPEIYLIAVVIYQTPTK